MIHIEPAKIDGTEGFTDAQWEAKLPGIAWREPLPIETDGERGLGCKFCLARHGLKGSEVATLPKTRADFDKHMRDHHPRK